MSDLVERLRANVGRITPYSLDLEAADEIERLRKLIDGAAETGEVYERRLSECEAENDALRSRLAECEKDAARYREVWNSWPLTFGEMLQSGYGVYPIENKAQGDAAIDAYLSREQK